MKYLFLLASILPLAMSTSRIMEMQVKTGDWPGSGMQFSGHLSFALCFGKHINFNSKKGGFFCSSVKRGDKTVHLAF